MTTHGRDSSLPDPQTLRAWLMAANPAVLLASLVSITGETALMEALLPQLRHEMGPAGITPVLPPAAQATLVDWGVAVLSQLPAHSGRDPLALADDAFLPLACALLGWPVEKASLPYLREQAGFLRFVPTVARTRAAPEGFSLAVIGAGMAGIAAAIAARHEGIACTVFEKNPGLGGVWWQNRYPGVGVDTPSEYYSFSFEVNPEWTHAFPEGAQYLDYLERVARKYGVMDSIVFDSDVRELRWDEAAARWTIVLERGGKREEHHANAVITAAGYLTRAQFPDVPGRERFSGPSFHSAEWQGDCDLTGQRIGVVGTGCTSVQIVDALIDQVGSLTLFQRQPHWVMPPAGEARLPASQLWLLENVPSFAQWSRLALYLLISDALYPQVRYDAQWAATHDLSISPQNDVQLQRGLAHLQASFADRPDLIAKLTPGFAPFGKRPIRDPGGYFTALKHPKSTVVSSGLREVVPEGIVDAEGTLHQLDAIVYATGFRLDFLAQWRIEGRDGRTLAEVWQDSPVAYNGCLVPGFPNLFITSGPHASAAHGGGHNFTVEAVVHYAIECLQTLFETGHSSVEVSPEAQQRWAEEVQDALADSVWVRETRATTYYRNGKGEVILASPFRMEDYWNRLRKPDLLDITLR